MTTIILLLLVAALCGFSFHFFYGRSAASIPFYLLAALGGTIVGFAAAVLLGWNFMNLGGLPVLTCIVGALLFLSLVQRIQITND
jgi:hypothetical protein